MSRRKIEEFKARLSRVATESLISRLQQRNVVKEAEIAVRELLSERGVSAKRIPKGDELDPQTKLFWDLIGKLRQHGIEEEANKIFFLGLVEGMSRFDLLGEFGQVILRVQREHSPAAPELQKG